MAADEILVQLFKAARTKGFKVLATLSTNMEQNCDLEIGNIPMQNRRCKFMQSIPLLLHTSKVWLGVCI